MQSSCEYQLVQLIIFFIISLKYTAKVYATTSNFQIRMRSINCMMKFTNDSFFECTKLYHLGSWQCRRVHAAVAQ